jgi:hypothetical protein
MCIPVEMHKLCKHILHPVVIHADRTERSQKEVYQTEEAYSVLRKSVSSGEKVSGEKVQSSVSILS